MTTIYTVKDTKENKVLNVFMSEHDANRCLNRCKRNEANRLLLIENGVNENILKNEEIYFILSREFPSITFEAVESKKAEVTHIVVESVEV